MRRFLSLFLLLAMTAGAAPFDPFAVAGIDERPGASIPLDRTIVDERSARRTLAAIAGGRPILLVPVQHDCPNLCGVTLDGLAAAMKSAAVKPDVDAAVIAFGIDPRETPQ